jgi:hypothetical protein
MPIHRILQPREGWLAGQVRPALGQAPTHGLQQRIGAQRVGVVLVGIATGDLEDALAHQGRQVVAGPPAPLGNARRQRCAQPQRAIGVLDPEQATIAGQASRIERRLQRPVSRRRELQSSSGRMGHGSTAWSGVLVNPSNRAVLCLVPGAFGALVNNSG